MSKCTYVCVLNTHDKNTLLQLKNFNQAMHVGMGCLLCMLLTLTILIALQCMGFGPYSGHIVPISNNTPQTDTNTHTGKYHVWEYV